MGVVVGWRLICSWTWTCGVMRWEGRVRWTDGRADGFGRAAVCGGFWAFSVGFCWGSGGRWREWGRPLSREPPAGLPGHRERAHDLPFPRACGGHVAVRARGLWGGVGWVGGTVGWGGFGRLCAGRPAGCRCGCSYESTVVLRFSHRLPFGGSGRVGHATIHCRAMVVCVSDVFMFVC